MNLRSKNSETIITIALIILFGLLLAASLIWLAPGRP